MLYGAKLLAEGRQAAADIEPPPSAFCRLHEVPHETAHKLVAKSRGEITYHAEFGVVDGADSWSSVRRAVAAVHDALDDHEQVLHRFGVDLDNAPAFELDPSDWTVPVHAQLGDNVIGSPNGFATTLWALRAGATTIGNLSQYFDVESAEWSDAAVTEDAVRALGAMAALSDRGALVHSALDRGPARVLPHLGALLGWAALEMHIVEDLCGARLAHSFGRLVSDPLQRSVLALALDDLRAGESLGSAILGNRVDLVRGDPEHNRAVIASCLSVDIATQLHRPTGHAIEITPISEVDGTPTAAEIVNAQLLGRAIERETRRSVDLFNWPRVDRIAALCASFAFEYRHRALRVLVESGINVYDPAAVLLALRQTDPQRLDQQIDLTAPPEVDCLEPWTATLRRTFVDDVASARDTFAGKTLVLAVIGAHEIVRAEILRALPAPTSDFIVLPADCTAASVARTAQEHYADAVLVGVDPDSASRNARRLGEALASEAWSGPVVIGALRPRVEGPGLSPETVARIEGLGMYTVDDIAYLGRALADRPPRRLLGPGSLLTLDIRPPAEPTVEPEPVDDSPVEVAPELPALAAEAALPPPSPEPLIESLAARTSVVAPPITPRPTPSPRRARRRKRTMFFAAAVAALALIAGYALLDRNHDEPERLTDATNGTLGQTTQNVPESSAAQEASTTIPGAPPVPAGASAPAADLTAIDLGFGVAIPVPPGWQVAADQRGGKTMSNGTASVSISVAGRAAGEDPAVPIQEHTNLIDAEGAIVSYSPAQHVGGIQSAMAVQEYVVPYETFDAATGAISSGNVYLYQRNDGLTALYDVRGGDPGEDLPPDTRATFEANLLGAPAIGATVDIAERSPFRVESVQPLVHVDDTIAFTVAPGFEVAPPEAGRGAASNSNYAFEVAKLTQQAGAAEAMRSAKSMLEQAVTVAGYEETPGAEEFAIDVVAHAVSWTGQALADGSQWAGSIDTFYDPETGNAVAVWRRWRADGQAPMLDIAAGEFMFRSVATSFTSIP